MVRSTPASEIPSSDPTPKSVCTIPVANPRYSRGTETMIAVWLGALKNPDPSPVRTRSAAGQIQLERIVRNGPMAKAEDVDRPPIEESRGVREREGTQAPQ